MQWFYNNVVSFEPPPDGMVFIDRVYCLDFNNFGDAEWQRLTAICDELPNRKPDSADGCPWWFGSDESSPPFLWASVEPSGWCVHGIVPTDGWDKWDAQLQNAASGLPRFACG